MKGLGVFLCALGVILLVPQVFEPVPYLPAVAGGAVAAIFGGLLLCDAGVIKEEE